MITQPKYRLADRVIDPSQCTIIKDGCLLKVELRAMQVLLCLTKHAGEPVSRDMLLEEVWSGGEVSDNAINRIIGLLRNQLGDNAKSPSFIKTLPKVGYVLIAEITLVKEVTKEEKFTEEVIAGSHIDERDTKTVKRKLFSILYEHSGKFVLLFISLVSLSSWSAYQYLSSDMLDISHSQNTELKRLTFLDGQEFSPVLSPDGKYLAFSQRDLGEKNWRIGMMEIESRLVVYLEDPMDSQGYPAFSPDGSRIAYLSYNNDGGCKINVVDKHSRTFGKIQKITDCKRKLQSTSIAWNPSGQSLFYIDEDQQHDYHTEKKVFSVSLNGNNKQQITQPYSIGRGDYSISLSPDGKYLAMVRNVRWYQTQVILLSLETGIWQDLFTVDLLLHTVAWARDSRSLIYRSMTGNLARYDLESSSHTQLTNIMQSIVSPISNQNGEIVAVLGEFFKTEIWRFESNFENESKKIKGKDKKNLENKVNKVTKYIFSNGMNYTASTNLDGSKVAFVSNRTGVPELWLKSGDEDGIEVKLTSFDEIISIKDISFSTSGRYILGRLNDSPFIYDITNKKIEHIDLKVNDNIYNVSWGPSSSSIVVTLDTLGLSSLELIDINTGELIQSLAEGGEYGKYSSNGMFFFTKRSGGGLWTLIGGEESLFLEDFTITSNLSWTIVDKYIYNLIATGGEYKLVRINIGTGERVYMDIYMENLSGYSISVDKFGAIFMLVSDPQNVDVIKLDYD
ncbi:winged helix-turn-helix domain-containing protein [Shewanella violacea]|uniref:OmpR/PhoB-type domain-containing protein n=1 Tax=Shewanella violacea (strain JCM 10179 / CIP 106290 / LMG 19151 / DSS12) TaxID=637905 RepID=D4ZC16_SHEVD|nr:winged helix-turn-helix domain-containing protein [Shewanella violacea]BAJ03561.1 hypothetical protein SVI_3590 [Shewanella violacea DSS12]